MTPDKPKKKQLTRKARKPKRRSLLQASLIELEIRKKSNSKRIEDEQPRIYN